MLAGAAVVLCCAELLHLSLLCSFCIGTDTDRDQRAQQAYKARCATMSATMSGPLGGDDYSDSEVISEVYSDYGSTIAELLERFTIDARPECTLKLRTK